LSDLIALKGLARVFDFTCVQPLDFDAAARVLPMLSREIDQDALEPGQQLGAITKPIAAIQRNQERVLNDVFGMRLIVGYGPCNAGQLWQNSFELAGQPRVETFGGAWTGSTRAWFHADGPE